VPRLLAAYDALFDRDQSARSWLRR
jgi:hypothetical protein